MSGLVNIGPVPWSRKEILAAVDEFSEVYEKRPIKNNDFGMRSPHMFAVWFIVRKLNPDIIIESGVWKGQGTWLLEMACPDAKLFSIDVNLSRREYFSKKAVYFEEDFSVQNWSEITDKTLGFFDDHQNAYRRLQQCKWFGVKHIIFEDNYPATQGDCYSLKKAFAGVGYEPPLPQKVVPHLVPEAAAQYEKVRVKPNKMDLYMLRKHLDVYYEFPPIFKVEKTRWNDEWSENIYPTPEPLLTAKTKPSHDILLDEALFYTWICYARLK